MAPSTRGATRMSRAPRPELPHFRGFATGTPDASHERRVRPSTITLGLVVTTLSACGGGSLETSGAAGTVGTGAGATGGTVTLGIAGAVGTGGGAVGGTGGTGGTPPACSGGGPEVVELMVMGADGMPVAARVTAAVTVTAIESCADVNCSSPTTTAASRIALAGAAS